MLEQIIKSAEDSVQSAIYVDGFNLYYGLAQPLGCKWVDLQSFFEKVYPDDDIQSINFFTSLVTGPTVTNQLRYLEALRALPKLNIQLGRFTMKPTRCGALACQHQHHFEFTTEKETDVRLATQMVLDCLTLPLRRITLVSGDSDFKPALEVIRAHRPDIQIRLLVPSLGKEVHALICRKEGRVPPQGMYASELRKLAHKDSPFPANVFLRSQFKPDFAGGIPSDWRIQGTNRFQEFVVELQQAVNKPKRG